MVAASRWAGVPWMAVGTLLLVFSLAHSLSRKCNPAGLFDSDMPDMTLQVAVYVGLTGLSFWFRSVRFSLAIGAFILLFLIISAAYRGGEASAAQHGVALAQWCVCWAVAGIIHMVCPGKSGSDRTMPHGTDSARLSKR